MTDKIKLLTEQLRGKTKPGTLILAAVIVGAVLLVLPKSAPAEKKTEPAATTFSLEQEQSRIAEALGRIEGAGKVEVILTLSSGTRKVIAEDTQEKTDGGSSREAVTVRTGSSAEEIVVLDTYFPEYRGALVVAQGADSAGLRLQMTRAVSQLTGLSADRISVIKMEG